MIARQRLIGVVNLAKRLLSDLLATLKSLSDLRAAKYYVCGIFPVEGVGLSTFNNNEDLDHCVDLAHAPLTQTTIEPRKHNSLSNLDQVLIWRVRERQAHVRQAHTGDNMYT